MEPLNKTINCLDCYIGSFEESLSAKNYKPVTLENYRHNLRRLGRLMEIEGIAPSDLTAELAFELGLRLPMAPKAQIKLPNLARRFLQYLIEIGVAERPPLTAAEAERHELLGNLEIYLLRQRGLSPRSSWLIASEMVTGLPRRRCVHGACYRAQDTFPRQDAIHASALLLPVFVRPRTHHLKPRTLRTEGTQAVGLETSALSVAR